MAEKKKTNYFQNRYDDLLLKTVQDTGDKVDQVDTKVDNLHGEVSAVKQEVKTINGTVARLTKTVFPDKPLKPKDLAPFWKDPTVLKIIAYVAAAAVLALLGLKGSISDLLK